MTVTEAIDQKLDPLVVTTIWDRLVSAADQASLAQTRASFTGLVSEGHDFACSLLDPHGGTLATSQFGNPLFLNTLSVTLDALLRKFSASSMRDGDVFITNDPWIGTGHSFDISVLQPVFFHGRVVAFAASVAHMLDIGGRQQWSPPQDAAIDVYDEGLLIPLMRLRSGDALNETFAELFRANVRYPDEVWGDIEAQLTATREMSLGVQRLLIDYELQDLDAFAEDLYGRSERAMRAAIEQIPDGVYSHELQMELLGTKEFPLLAVDIRVEGSDITVDYSRSSPQIARTNENAVRSFVQAYTFYTLRLALVPNLPDNAGFHRSVHVVTPEGTVVNARRPSAVVSRHMVGHHVCDVIFGALAPAIPDRVMAQGGSTPIWMMVVTGHNADGSPFSANFTHNGGLGALPASDGIAAPFPTNCSNQPVEMLESQIPAVFERKALIPDSEGAGRWRGGFGQRLEVRALEAFEIDVLASRVRKAPEGMLGGHSARAGRVMLNDRDLGGGATVRLERGDVLVLETAGGGGRFSPTERDRAAVLSDVRSGLVTIERADAVYGIDPRIALTEEKA